MVVSGQSLDKFTFLIEHIRLTGRFFAERTITAAIEHAIGEIAARLGQAIVVVVVVVVVALLAGINDSVAAKRFLAIPVAAVTVDGVSVVALLDASRQRSTVGGIAEETVTAECGSADWETRVVPTRVSIVTGYAITVESRSSGA